MRRALRVYRGLEEETLDAWTGRWFLEAVRGHFSREAVEAIGEHRRRGDLVVLLTSSSPYLSSRVAEELDLDGYICSRYGVEGGLLTGEPVLPVCYGEGKVTLAEAYASANGVDLSESYFYSDSYTDLPMLSRVGKPRVVNPDPRLRVHAFLRRWPVMRWTIERPAPDGPRPSV